MKIITRSIFSIFLLVGFNACSTNTTPPAALKQTKAQEINASTVLSDSGEKVAVNPTPVANSAIGGPIANSMDSLDRSKMIHALDKATGKTTEWSNPITHTDYAVTPIKKIVLNGNSCRQYLITADNGDGDKPRQFNGTVCIGEDGNWKPVD